MISNTASFGAGALAGALLSASLGRASWPILLAAAGGLGAGELLLAPQHSILAAALILGAMGACFSLYTSNSNSTLQLAVPDHLRGRLLAMYSYMFFGTAPLGGLLAGWLADRGGTLLALLVGGSVAALTAAVGAVAWRRSIRGTRPRRAVASTEPATTLAATPRE